MQPRVTLSALVMVTAAAGPALAADGGVTPTALGTIGLLVLVALVISTLQLRARLARSRRAVQELGAAVERLTQGDYGADIRSEDTAEIGSLAQELDRLRLGLRSAAVPAMT